jgi:ATP-dependent helicase/nuclease subunit B
MHNLYCTPLGETVRHRFLAALIEATAGGKCVEQAYLLPSDHLLGSVRRQLRAAGPAGHERPNLLAFDDLVKEICDLAGCRQRFMDRMTQELVVAKVLDDLNDAGRLAYFGAIKSFPGYVSTVTSLLAEIKRTGVTPDQFADLVGASGSLAKDKEVAAIYAAYQDELATRGLADLEERYLLAIDALRDGLDIPYKHIYISEFYIFNQLQLELVRALRGVAAIDIGLIYEKNRPAIFAAVEATYTDLVGMGFTPQFPPPIRPQTGTLANIRRQLFADRPAAAADAPGVSVVSAPGRAREMALAAAAVKKLLLAGRHQPEEIAIVVRDPGLYGGLQEIAADYGLPLSLPQRYKLADQAAAALLTGALAAKADGGSRQAVLSLLKSPLVTAAFGIDAEAVEKAALDKVIRGWREWFGLFRATEDDTISQYRRPFDRLARLVAALPRDGVCGRHTAALRALMATVDPAAVLGAAYREGRLPLTVVKAELLAADKCREVLDAVEDGFAAAGREIVSLDTAAFLRYFRQALAEPAVTVEGYNERGVQVVSPAGVRGTTFKAVFLLGLTDGEFPAQSSENWLYDDRERKELKAVGDLLLPVAASRRDEENLYFAVAVALAEEQLVLSCHEDAETLASPYLAEVLRLFAPGTVTREKYAASQFFADSYEESYSPGDLAGKVLLDLAQPAGPPPAIADYVFARLLDGDFRRRLAAEAERRGDSPYGGLIGPLGPQAGAAYSITALEDYAQCPFAYYAKRVLRLEDWEEREEEAGLDIIGTIYHEVLAGFLRAHRRQTLRPEALEDYCRELDELLDGVCSRLAAADKLVDGKLWAYRRRRLATALRRWLEFEIAEQNADGLAFAPAHLEWGFGLPIKDGMDENSQISPLELACGEGLVRVVGKVDRIDAAGDKLAVIDYKRKYGPRFRDLENGLDLQAALYIMAVERHLCPAGGQVAGGGYYSIEGRRKDGGMWRAELAADIRHRAAKDAGNLAAEDWSALQDEIRRKVLAYARGIEAGLFPVRPAAPCPPYCIARTICRYDAGEQAGGESDG